MTDQTSEFARFMFKIRYPAWIGILILLNCFALRNFFYLSADVLYGNGSISNVFPRPLYPVLRIPETPAALQHQGVGRLATDFAAIYFPGFQISRLQDAYDPETSLDPWHRASRSAPFVILLCYVTLGNLPFGLAALAHLVLQTLLFYVVLAWAFGQLGIRRYALTCLLFANICLFLTPVGLTWFERGQFSLYIASSCTLLMLGLLQKKPGPVAASALLAFLKWTSFPALLVICVVYLLGAKGTRDLRLRSLTTALFAAVIAVLVFVPLLFTAGLSAFLDVLFFQELHFAPQGLSLLQYVSGGLVKALPALLILVGCLNIRRNGGGIVNLIPYALGVVAILLLYPTYAYEYSLPTLLGFLPLIVFWRKQALPDRSILRNAIVYAFFLFLLVASFSTRVIPSLSLLVGMYVLFSVVFIVAPALLAARDLPNTAEAIPVHA